MCSMKKKLTAIVLAAAMAMDMMPVSALAAEGETVKGEEVTVSLTDSMIDRENNFNKGWKFYLGTSNDAQKVNYNDSSWDSVDLPHDFSITQEFTTSGEAESGFLPGGTGWYRKSFTMSAESKGKNIMLNFDGVYKDATVYVNGHELGTHHYGYSSFAFDISDYLEYDGATENVVAVKVVNEIPSSRWYSGSGIYRDVTLLVTDPVHVDLNGTYVTTPDIANETGTVKVETDIVNDGESKVAVTVKNTVYEKDGTEALASAVVGCFIETGKTQTVTSSQTVAAPKLWSVDSPNLYRVVTEVSVDNEVVDTYETEFGFRWFTFSSDGFSLNGKHMKLNGVCLHHDQGALGSAAYDDAIYRQLSIMKDMGVNAVRTSHNPAAENFIEICDELGLLVIEEAFDGLNEAKNENSNDFAKHFEASVDVGLYGATDRMTCSEYAARSMVKRDRNAASVFAWSFGNEIQEGTYWNTVDQFAGFCENFIEWVNEEDGSRIVTSGDNNRGGDSRLVAVLNKIIEANGVVGFNYANDSDTLSNLVNSYGGTHGCIIASETSSAVNSRGIYSSQESLANADGKYHLTSYDTSCVTWGITAHDSIYNTYNLDSVCGEFIWTGFDYIGEPTPWNGTGSGTVSGGGATPNSSYFGAVDTAGFEKDTYYLYRSQWNKDAATVHLVTAWDSDNMLTSSEKTPVWIYSNAAKVELYRGGIKIGTSTRETHTSSAGHTYYTYTSESHNTSVCTVSNGTGADALYGVFNVVYQDGSVLEAKAYDENGNEISLDDSCGRHKIQASTASKLVVSQDKTTAKADGSSLVYISVDVTDGNGNLDTTATNEITFTLSGNGEIVGVDNGDQATTAKYQSSSVLTNSKTAKMKAYAGKALAIVRTTENSGSFTVNVSSSGLTGGSVTVVTTEVSEDSSEGIVSYTMTKDYSVKVGTIPKLETKATLNKADGTTDVGTIKWDSVYEKAYNTAGDYTIKGTLSINEEEISVTAKLHVIADVIAMRNISTATIAGVVPTLPSMVQGVLADGTVIGEFAVVWETVSADELTTIDKVITVSGTATVLGDETLPVTCSIRVAEAVEKESSNIAPQHYTLEQDIESSNQSDNLLSIVDGNTNPGEATDNRWTNWSNRTNSNTATLTMTWATAQMIDSVNLYYRYDSCCAKPESVVFSYSADGTNYTKVEATESEIDATVSNGAAYTYKFANPVNPIGLRVKFTQQSGTSGTNCVGLYEMEVMTYAAQLEYNTGCNLSEITVDGTAIDSFSADTLKYEATGLEVAAATAENAGITVLPVHEGVVRVLTISEDGSKTKTYEIFVTCGHKNTEIKDAKEATCVEDGYTGDTYCTDCNSKIKEGKVVKAKGHSWNDGEVTKVATEEENGIKTYTCTVCKETKTEEIMYVKDRKTPTADFNVTVNDGGKLVMTGVVEDYANISDYCDITAHGLLYMQTDRLGARILTASTSGRTRINFSGYKEDGSYIYRLTPASKDTSYTIRAFVAYTDQDTGKTCYAYSDAVVGSYNSLHK